MEVLKKGNYKLRNWSLEVECTGESYKNKRKPCHSILKLEDGDFVFLDCEENPSPGIVNWYHSYGFICCECSCFTGVPSAKIPEEIRRYCPRIATKGSKEYKNLTEEGKRLSEYL